MRVITKQSYGHLNKMREEVTYLSPFLETVSCPECKTPTKLMMLIDDDEGWIERERPQDVKTWPHDCVAVALYLCTNCGKLIAEWNQA